MWSKLSVEVTPPGGAPVKRAGHTLSVLRKSGGRWQLARDANLLTPVNVS
jgi:ketosteroid isomerase-like protein